MAARRYLLAAVPVAAAVLVYHRALSAYFFDDDFQYLVGSWAFDPRSLIVLDGSAHFYRPVIDV